MELDQYPDYHQQNFTDGIEQVLPNVIFFDKFFADGSEEFDYKLLFIPTPDLTLRMSVQRF